MNKVIKLSHLDYEIAEHIDLFICSASFEDRSLEVASRISSKNIRNSLICYNTDQGSIIDENLSALKISLLETNLSVLGLNSEMPIQNADLIVSFLKKFLYEQGKISLLVDVTTFTRETLLILANILYIHNHFFSKICFIYTSAKEYSFLESPSEKWLTKGVKSIRSVLGFSGEFTPSARVHLVAMVGFEIERTIKIIETLEPALLSLGMPSEKEVVDKNHFPINYEALKYIEKSFSDKIMTFEFSCRDPFKTKDNLVSHLKLDTGHNVCISPLNNKISTLGAALYCFENPKTQICYANANAYNVEGYSNVGDTCIIFTLF